jgi:membrane-associated HD superfamily phosphohydrolase
VVWLAASATILYRRNAPVFDYVVGQLADRNIYSEVDFEYEDQQETQRLRNAQRNQTPPVYRVDRYTLDLSLSYLDELRKAVTSRAAALEPAADGTAGDSGLPPPPVAAFLEGAGDEEILELHGLFSDSAFWRLLTDATRQTLQLGVAAEPGNLSHAGDPPVGGQVSLMDDQGRRAVREAAGFADPTRAAARIVDRVVPNVEPQAQPLLRGLQDVLGEIVQPNLVCDRRLTDTVRRLAAEQVTPAKTVVRANILLLRAGSRVTPEDLTRLSEHQKEFQRRRQQSDTTIETLGVVLLVLVLMVFACAAFHLMREAVIHHTGYALLLAGAIVLQLFLTRVVGDLYYRYWLSSILLFPLLPLSFCSMLAAQLLGVRAAITAGLVVSGIASLQYGRSLELLLIGTLSSFVAAVAIREARRRFHIFRAGVSVGLTVFLCCVWPISCPGRRNWPCSGWPCSTVSPWPLSSPWFSLSSSSCSAPPPI